MTFRIISRTALVASRSAPNHNLRPQLQFPSIRYFTAGTSTLKPDIKLYQYHICPFCNITKSLLEYTKLDYEKVEVNPLTKAELKPWSGEYKKVPIAVIDGKQVNGSEEILDAILNVSNKVQMDEEIMNNDDFQKSDNAQKWTRFAIDDLAALLYPNICGTLSDSYDAFGYVKDVESFSTLQKISIQYIGALAMHFAANKVKCKYVTHV